MLFIQQSSSFRAWTSRALMLYFRRVLIFLVVSPRQNINNNLCLLQQDQQQTVYFTDDEDKIFTEYRFKKLSQGLNNSMTKSIESSSSTDQSSQIYNSIQTPVTEQFEPSSDNSNQGLNSFSIKTINSIETNEDDVSDVSVYQHQQTPINYHNRIYTLQPHNSHLNSTDSIPSYPSCPHCLPSFSLYHSSDDEDNIYEKYQTSFSHILHQTKSLHTIRNEDKLESMLVLEPNTSIITVCHLTYHLINPMITSNICVRLIADRKDLSIQCDTKPIGCKKPLSYFPRKYIQQPLFQSTSILEDVREQKSNLKILTNQFDKQQSLINSNKKFQETSIMIDLPYKILYIDS